MRRLWVVIVLAVAVPAIPARPVSAAATESHDGGECDDWNGDCGDGYEQRYDQNYGSRDDRNRNRNRDRGAFSPGPFRDSPVTICLPYSCNSGGEQSGGNRNDRGNEPPPEEQRARSISCLIPVPYHCDRKPEEEL